MGTDLLQQPAVNASAPRLVLVTGGCRSGKSAFALDYVEKTGLAKTFLATCPVLDEEMADRVRRHREERRGRGWETVEEERELARAVSEVAPGRAVLVDCLTLWVNNIIFHGEVGGRLPDEDEAASRASAFVQTCRERSGTVVAVTNEVGLGIVPDNPLVRRFRDLAGRVNQTVAAGADEVYFLISGLPTRIK